MCAKSQYSDIVCYIAHIEVMQSIGYILSPNKPSKRFVIVMEILVSSVIGSDWVYGRTVRVA